MHYIYDAHENEVDESELLILYTMYDSHDISPRTKYNDRELSTLECRDHLYPWSDYRNDDVMQ